MRLCNECGLDHELDELKAIEWHCKNPCEYCNWSLEFKHEGFCPITLEANHDRYAASIIPTQSGEYARNELPTGEYDMATYVYALDYIKGLRLSCMWRIEPQPKGVIILLYRSPATQKIFVESISALDKWGDGLKELSA